MVPLDLARSLSRGRQLVPLNSAMAYDGVSPDDVLTYQAPTEGAPPAPRCRTAARAAACVSPFELPRASILIFHS